MKLSELIKELEKHNEIDIPNDLIGSLIKHLNYKEGKADLITEEDMDNIFISKEVSWPLIVKSISFNITNLYAINCIDIDVSFLDKDGNEIYVDNDRYIPDKMVDIIPDLHEIPTSAKLLVDCFDDKLVELLKSLNIKFVQGSGDEIIDLDINDRPLVFVTSDT